MQSIVITDDVLRGCTARQRTSALSEFVMPLSGILNAARELLIGTTPAPREEETRTRPSDAGAGRDAVLVIDTSGSMQQTDWKPSRLEAAKEAAKAYVQRLATEEPDSRVAIISYSQRARVVCGLSTVRASNALGHAIDSITSIMWTNITSGLEKARRLLRGSPTVCQVVLLTDGHHNTGSKPEPVAGQLRRNAIIECVGIGGSPSDVDEASLKEIASSHPDGTKRYRWIGDTERLVEHFHNLAGRITRQ